ncbi:MAG: hypothetical protein EOM79_04000, partial [Epsilonproteobacteria bacterium]|nr:hypothetical protein [Campylobacterota bacterium]
MIISKSKLILDKTIPIQKDFLFDKKEFAFKTPLLDIKKCFGNVEITKYRNFIRLNADLDVNALLTCSYSLEPFDYELKIHEEVLLGEKFDDEVEAIVIPGDNIELEKILFAIISSNLPLKPVKPGASLPKSGEGYRVIDDAQLAKEGVKIASLRSEYLEKLNIEAAEAHAEKLRGEFGASETAGLERELSDVRGRLARLDEELGIGKDDAQVSGYMS